MVIDWLHRGCVRCGVDRPVTYTIVINGRKDTLHNLVIGCAQQLDQIRQRTERPKH